MDSQLIGLVIGGIAVIGGLGIAAVAIAVSVPWGTKERMAKMEAQSKERMALIEKGIDPQQFFKEKKSAGSDPLFWGLLCIGVGLGIFLGYILSRAMGWDAKELTNALGVVFGGLGLVIYKVYSRRSEDQHPS